MSERCDEDVIFKLTEAEVPACVNELGISNEPVTDDVIELVKGRVRLAFGNWPEVVKSVLSEACKCPLKLVCYPSCFWWQDGKCILPRGDNKEPGVERGKRCLELKTVPKKKGNSSHF